MKHGAHLSQKQRKIVSRIHLLISDGEMIRATMINIETKCGKESCKCMRGEKHSSTVIEQSSKGKTRMRTVPKGQHKNIEILSYSEVEDVSGFVGQFNVKVRKKARYVNLDKCTGCGECAKYCPVEVPNEWDVGTLKRQAIYRPFPQAVPITFAIDKRDRGPCVQACPADGEGQRTGAGDPGEGEGERLVDVGGQAKGTERCQGGHGQPDARGARTRRSLSQNRQRDTGQQGNEARPFHFRRR